MQIRRLLSTCLVLLATGMAATAAPLQVGQPMPDVTVRNAEDKEVRLTARAAERPTVLVFYRGGWCPFCSKQLKGLESIQKDLQAAGAQLLAISMDQPSKLKETSKALHPGYELLSDSSAQAVKAFGIGFTVEESIVDRYRKVHRIDLEAAAGQKHHILPHPSVFVVDSTGKIRFAHVNENYKERLEPAKILEAVRALKP